MHTNVLKLVFAEESNVFSHYTLCGGMGYAFKLVAMIKPAIYFAETIFFYCNFLLPKVIYKVLVIQLAWQLLHSRYVSSSLVFHNIFFLPQVVNLLPFRDSNNTMQLFIDFSKHCQLGCHTPIKKYWEPQNYPYKSGRKRQLGSRSLSSLCWMRLERK